MVKLSSWGRLSHNQHTLVELGDRSGASTRIAGNQPGICFGMGRSYGDVCLNTNGVSWQTRGMDRLISFDETGGLLHCEAGALLKDIQRLLVPRGWMLPVTPGTQLITVGGAIANDVHGKNHHGHGTFGNHVISVTLQRTSGELVICNTTDLNNELLKATIGGLGLTGVILDAKIQLRRINNAWLDTETIPYRSLHEFFELSDHSESDWEHTVSWIDCLSGQRPRGIFLRANHASKVPPDARPPKTGRLTVPLTPPLSLVNRLSLKPFNAAYYALNARKAGPGHAHYESFFYPLDSLQHWNRMYGPRGFYQYQCVVPPADCQDAVQAMLQEISRSGEGSFLAVLKTFAERQAPGMLSFPMAGATLALDFPNNRQRTITLMDRLDRIVSEAGGRLYPAKDARMPATMFEQGYPRLGEFLKHRDPGISSDMSRRLMGS